MVVYSEFNSDKIYENIIYKEIISSLQISNFSNSPLIITHKGTAQTVPAYNPANVNPPYYKIDGDGTFSKIELKIEYQNNVKNGFAIIAARTLCKNQ